MAKKRMFSKQITESDEFLAMPLSTQALYFHLGMDADDDGFINSPNRIRRTIGASDDDFAILIAKNFIIPFESGVVVQKHWRINNYIRKDRYTPTAYTEEMGLLTVKKNQSYQRVDGFGIPKVDQVGAQNRLDKNRLIKSSSKDGQVNLLQVLTPEETELIFDLYEDADYLIDEVEAEINRKMKADEIENFYRYVIGYATNKGWLVKEVQK